MEGITQLFLLFLSGILINNFVMSRFLGICPFLGVSRQIGTALGMGIAVTFVMCVASILTFLVYEFILIPLDITFLYNVCFILVIAALVQFTEMVIKKTSKGLYNALGVYLPLITTNCAVLGVVVLNMQSGYNLIFSVVSSLGVALGFTLAIVLFAGIRTRLKYNNIPEVFEGFPIAMITAGLMSIAFFGFQGLI